MKKEETKEEEVKQKKRRPYEKPSLSSEELFEATVLSCVKRARDGCAKPRRLS
jgi:hypothetical protein